MKRYSAVAKAYYDKIRTVLPAEMWEKEGYAVLWDSPYTHLLSVLFRKRADSHKLAYDALQAAGVPDKFVKELPFFSAVRSRPDSLRVFLNVNLKQGIGNRDELAEVSWATNVTVLEPLLQTIVTEQQDENKKKRWESVRSGKKFLFKSEVMPIARVLTRFTSIKKDYDDASIRDMAQRTENELKPIELFECNSPEDYMFVYENGPSSCMKSGSEVARWKDFLLKGMQLHPTMWYHFNPMVQGVALTKGKKVLARTMIFRDSADGPFTKYGRVYMDTNESSRLLIKALTQRGITAQIGLTKDGAKDVHEQTVPFRIPGVWSDTTKDYICPFPYVDNIKNNMYAWFDVATKEFIFDRNKPHAKADIFNLQSPNGYVRAKVLLSSQKCHYCGAKTGGSAVFTVDGHVFCGEDHACAAEYVTAMQADGQEVWMRDNSDIVQCHHSGVRYVNMYVASRNNMIPYRNSIFSNRRQVVPKSRIPGRYGCVELDGELIAMDDGYVKMLRKGTVHGITPGEQYAHKDGFNVVPITVDFGATQEDLGIDW